MLAAFKELTPLVYGENSIKYIYNNVKEANGYVCFNLHWHDRMELIYVVKGNLELHTDEGHCPVLPGQIAVIDPRQIHGGFAGCNGVDYHTIMFEVEKFRNETIASRKYLQALCENEISFQTVIDDERLQRPVEYLVDILANTDENKPLLAIGIIYTILDVLFRCYTKNVKIAHVQDKSFDIILKYINEHYTEKCLSKEISKMFGYNEAYFCRRFREVTGITFSKYIQALRMEYAQKQIKSTTDEIGMIAWKCGFSDPSYFSNCFKKLFGMTPMEFRNMKE